jgi:hypothetical protein
LTWAGAVSASPLGIASDFQDKEWMAVDTRPTGLAGAGNIYVCWRRFNSTFARNGIRFSRSTNGGVSFTEMAANVSSSFTTTQGCVVAVSPVTGHVYVAWRDSVGSIRFRRSTNAGVTFGPEIAVGALLQAEGTTSCGGSLRTTFVDSEAGFASRAIRSSSFPSMDVNPVNGHIYVVWHRAGLGGGSLSDIAFARSIDGGLSFGATSRLNFTVTGQQFFPQIAVNIVGRLKVIYYSTQNSPTNRLLDVYEVFDDDGVIPAAGLGGVRVTGSSFNRPQTNPNFDTFIASCYMGDYNGIHAAKAGTASSGLAGRDFYMAWGDNHLDGNLALAGVQPDPDIRFDRNVGIDGCYVRATRTGASSMQVEWRRLSDYNTGVRLYRKVPGATSYALIATLAGTTQVITDGAAPASNVIPTEYLVNPFNGSQSFFLRSGVCQN